MHCRLYVNKIQADQGLVTKWRSATHVKINQNVPLQSCWGFNYQLLPEIEAFQVYKTLKCIHDSKIHRGRQHMKIKDPYSAQRPAMDGFLSLHKTQSIQNRRHVRHKF